MKDAPRPANSIQALAADYLRDLESRVAGRQGGVPTFADNAHRHILQSLIKLGLDQDWGELLSRSSAPGAAALAGEWHRLSMRLASRAQGRLRRYRERVFEGRSLGNDRRSELPDHVMWASQGVEHSLAWRGRPLFKSVFDFALYPMIIHELRPATIIEIGAGSGASADFLAHAAAAANLRTQVLSVDIDPPDLGIPAVRFIRGDARELGLSLVDGLLAAQPRPWLVIEDAHVAVDRVLAFFDARLGAGDYIVVEDSAAKGEVIAAFLDSSPHCYLVDSRYTDFFGRNATSAIDSIFRRE